MKVEVAITGKAEELLANALAHVTYLAGTVLGANSKMKFVTVTETNPQNRVVAHAMHPETLSSNFMYEFSTQQGEGAFPIQNVQPQTVAPEAVRVEAVSLEVAQPEPVQPVTLQPETTPEPEAKPESKSKK